MPDKLQSRKLGDITPAEIREMTQQAALRTEAIAAIALFGGEYLDRKEATELLGLWRRVADLDEATVDQVLAVFPLSPDPS